MMRKALLACGVGSSVLYAAMNVFVPMMWDGYSVATQTVSELSAIGAPTRSLWVRLGTIYSVLVAAFGWGVWKSAGGNRRIQIVGGLMVAYAVIGLFWPPMHLRGTEFTLTDTLHIVWAVVTVLLMFLALGLGATAFGKRFHAYSIATIVVFLVFGTLAAMDGPRVASNLPTPWVGVWERINIGAFLVWIVVLATTLWRGPVPAKRGGGSR